jgi:hypothetical protein
MSCAVREGDERWRHPFYLTLLLVVLLPLCSCSHLPFTSSLDDEALEFAQRRLDSLLTRCGDSYFGIHRIADDNTLYQFKNPTLKVTSEKISEAGRLNGVEWLGYSTFWFTAWRHNFEGRWSEWRTGGMTLAVGLDGKLIKKQGKWQFDELSEPAYEKVNCSEVPPG